MKVHEAIYKRKSIRKYKDQGIELDVINEIINMSRNVDRLNNNIDMDIHVVCDGKKIHNLFKGIISNYVKIKSPHYLVITSEKKDDYLFNVGYTIENLVLEMTSIGIGTCWVGAGFNKDEMKKIIDIKENQEPIILVSFGEADDFFNMYRTDVSQFNRKKLNEIVTGDSNSNIKKILDAARLAPSACNLQPWNFRVDKNEIGVFKSIPRNIVKKKIVETYGDIDIGIAMSHIVQICRVENIGYEIVKVDVENNAHAYSIKLC